MAYLYIDNQCRMWVELHSGPTVRVIQVWEADNELRAQTTDQSIIRIDQQRPDPQRLVQPISWRRFFTADIPEDGVVERSDTHYDRQLAQAWSGQAGRERLQQVEEEERHPSFDYTLAHMVAGSGFVGGIDWATEHEIINATRAALDLPPLADVDKKPDPTPPAVPTTRADATMLVDDNNDNDDAQS